MLRPVAVALSAAVSEGLNVISRDSIGLPDPFHPSDERTVQALSGLGAILLEERARATQIKNSPFSPGTGQHRNPLSHKAGGGWRFLSVLIKVTGPGPQQKSRQQSGPFLQVFSHVDPVPPTGWGWGWGGQPGWPPEFREVLPPSPKELWNSSGLNNTFIHPTFREDLSVIKGQ